MITICRTMMGVLIGLWLGGCSVVIFEDSAVCPAQIACTVDPFGTAPTAEGTLPSGPVLEGSASDRTPVDKTASSTSKQQGTVSPTASMSSIDVDTEIDGHLSYFDVDSAALRTPTITGLLFVAEYLKANPAVRILVEGHCDERGTRDYNLALGEKRAEAVRVQLARRGIDRHRIKTKSFGKERPAILGTSPEAWAKNRRTIIRLITE
jgi:peptidoglycan-associated lipoprotein